MPLPFVLGKKKYITHKHMHGKTAIHIFDEHEKDFGGIEGDIWVGGD